MIRPWIILSMTIAALNGSPARAGDAIGRDEESRDALARGAFVTQCIDAALRTRFLETDPAQWPGLTRKAVQEQGQSFAKAIHNALTQGRISEQTAAFELREIG